MAKKTNKVDLYTIPPDRIGKVVYTREGAIELKEDLSPEQKEFLVSQGVKLIKKEEPEEATE